MKLFLLVISFFLCFLNLSAQSKSTPKAQTNCKTSTACCVPSSCRGTQTKFNEAKVITNLRNSLVSLKAEMEQSGVSDFKSETDNGQLIGKTDDESLQIIAEQVQLIEATFVKTLNHQPNPFILPDNKAKQVKYLSSRIETLQQLL